LNEEQTYVSRFRATKNFFFGGGDVTLEEIALNLPEEDWRQGRFFSSILSQ